MGKDREQSDCKIVGLEINRQRTFDPNIPYGSVSPEDGTYYIIDGSSQKIANKTKKHLLKWVQQHPEYLPDVVNGLIDSGKYFESIKYEVPKKDIWVDGELSSRMVTETILGIGEAALPFLEKSEEEYAKKLERMLQENITSKQK